MKCPKCTLVTTNKRDICPRCEFDLRLKKRELGLPIENPNATYAQLLDELRALNKGTTAPASSPTTQPEPASAVQTATSSTPWWKKVLGKKPASSTEQLEHSSTPAPSPKVTNPATDLGLTTSPAPNGAATQPAEVTPVLAEATSSFTVTASSPTDVSSNMAAVPLTVAPSVVDSKPVGTTERAKTSIPPGPSLALGTLEPAAVDSVSDADLAGLIAALDQLAASQSAEERRASVGLGASGGIHAEAHKSPPAARSTSAHSGSVDSPLFSSTPSIDEDDYRQLMETLDEIEDEMGEEADLDELSLFENKVSDLLRSAEDSVAEAKSAAESLSLHELGDVPSLDALEDLFPTTPSQRAPETEPTTEPTTEQPAPLDTASPSESVGDLLSEPEPTDLDLDIEALNQPAVEAASTPVPPTADYHSIQVAPDVLEFGDDDAALEQQLEAMFGPISLDVEAVKVPQTREDRNSSAPSHSFTTDDGMEIEFEFDGEESEPPPAAEVESDPLLSELMSTYESLQAGTQHHSLSDVVVPPETRPYQAAALEGHSHADRAHLTTKFSALLDRLSHVSDDLRTELSELFHTALHASGSAATLPVTPASPLPESGDEQHADDDSLEIAFDNEASEEDLLSADDDDSSFQALEAELSTEIAALEADGSSLFHDDAIATELEAQTDSVAAEPSTEEFAALEAEFSAELESLEAEGVTLYHEDHQGEAEVAPEPFHADAVLADEAPTEELAALEAELATELESLEADGVTLFHEEHEADADVAFDPAHTEENPADEAPSAELAALEAEFSAELEGLEAEGVTLYHEDHEAEAAVAFDSMHADEIPADEAPTEDLAALEAELSTELESLEADGVTLFQEDHEVEAEVAFDPAHTDEIPAVEAPSAELAALEAEFSAELEGLEAEGVTLYHEDHEAEAEVLLAPQLTDSTPLDEAPTEDLTALEAELSTELESLEADGVTLFHEVHESDAEVAFEPQHSDAVPSDEAPSEELAALEAELSTELESLEADGVTLFHEDHQADAEVAFEPQHADAVPSDEAPSEELAALEAELSTELESLEADGVTLFHEEHEADAEVAFEPQHADAVPSDEAPSEELAALEAELSTELESLEADGVTLFHEEHEAESEVAFEPQHADAVPSDEAPSEELAALEAELSTELESLEADGVTLFHEDHEADAEVAFEPQHADAVPSDEAPSEELAALEAELSTELESLEADGVTLFHDEHESEPGAFVELQHAVENPADEAAVDVMAAAETELSPESESRDADGGEAEVAFAPQHDGAFSADERPAAELSELEADGETFHDQVHEDETNFDSHDVSEQEIRTTPIGLAAAPEDASDAPEEPSALDIELEYPTDWNTVPNSGSAAPEIEVIPTFGFPDGAPHEEPRELSSQGEESSDHGSAEPLPGSTGAFLQADLLRALEGSAPFLTDEETTPATEPEPEQLPGSTGAFLQSDLLRAFQGELDQQAPVSEPVPLPLEQAVEVNAEVEPVESANESVINETSTVELGHDQLPGSTGAFLQADLLRAISGDVDHTAEVSQPSSFTFDSPSDLSANDENLQPAVEAESDSEPVTHEFILSPSAAEPDVSESASSEVEVSPTPALESAPEIEFEYPEQEEISLGDLASIFVDPELRQIEKPVRGAETRSVTPLSAPNFPSDGTGMFLAADLAAIVEPPVAPRAVAQPPMASPEFWNAAHDELRGAEDVVELTVSSLSGLEHNDGVVLLFDVVGEDIRDPERHAHRVMDTTVNETRPVESGSLQQALKTFEKEATVVAKRRVEQVAREQLGIIEEIENPIVELPAAPRWRRIGAMWIDALCVLVLTIIASWFIVLPPPLTEAIKAAEPLSAAEVWPVVFPVLGILYGTWLGFSALLIFTGGQTTGGRIFGIEVRDRTGSVPGFSQSLLRAMSFTVTAWTLGLGLLPILGSKRLTLHDRLSRTQVTLKDGDLDEGLDG